MKTIFKVGDSKTFERIVCEEDTAKFESGAVHNVYATFAIARDAEWCSRLFVLDFKEENEEGIGTFVTVKHISPAKIGDAVLFESVIVLFERNKLNCIFSAKVKGKLIAEGETGQKILLKSEFEKLFDKLKND